MRVWATCAALVLLAGCATPPAPVVAPMFPTFDTRADPAFGDATVPLRSYLAAPTTERHAGTQHFCIVGYHHGRGSNGRPSRAAQVHWREGNRLILWEGADADGRADAIRFSRRDLDLDRDVVATLADVGGSTYLVTQGWLRQVLADCAAHGTRYAIAR